MYPILVVAIAIIASTFIGLSLLIIVNKAVRDARCRWRRVRQRELEPGLARYTRGEEDSIVAALGGRSAAPDRVVVEQLLLMRLDESQGLERERLARAMEQLGFVDGYLERLRSRNWWHRAEAAEHLGLALARRAVDELAEAMNDEVPEVRFRAARALGRIGGLAAARPLIRALDDPSRWSTLRIADVLTSMGREVGDELTSNFDRLGPRARVAALDILAGVRYLNVAPWLRARLQDESPDVRSRAAKALGVVGDIDAGPLLAAALRDRDWPVRAMAAKSLGMILHVPAIADLCEAMRDSEWWVRANAAEALRLMGPVGLSALRSMLDDPDRYARHQAIFMLEEAGVVDEEVDHLSDPAPDRRSQARLLIQQVLATGLDGRLRELAALHPDPRVRLSLAGLLADADGRLEAAAS